MRGGPAASWVRLLTLWIRQNIIEYIFPKFADNEGYDMGMTEEKTTQSNTTQLVLDDGRIEEIREFTSPEELYHDLVERVRKYHPSDDISLIEKAYHLARQAHEGQVRKSGEPYIIHPLCVAIMQRRGFAGGRRDQAFASASGGKFRQ